jgi:hypothetical protein
LRASERTPRFNNVKIVFFNRRAEGSRRDIKRLQIYTLS